MKITYAKTLSEIEEVRRLFREYAEFMGSALSFEGRFEEELAGLPGKYTPPEGALLIAGNGQTITGCVALRKFKDGVCEMKRLFVRPQFRGQGIGRALAENIIKEGQKFGYKTMRLGTLDRLQEAMKLYESLGFKRVKPYYNKVLPGAVFWELDLKV